MTSTSRFPSALTRSNSLGPAIGSARKGPSTAEVAMMDAETYKQYARHRGEWQSADSEAIGSTQNPGEMGIRGNQRCR